MRLTVRQKHVDEAVRLYSTERDWTQCCPIALALRDRFGPMGWRVYPSDRGVLSRTRHIFNLSDEAAAEAHRFDLDESFTPGEYELQEVTHE